MPLVDTKDVTPSQDIAWLPKAPTEPQAEPGDVWAAAFRQGNLGETAYDRFVNNPAPTLPAVPGYDPLEHVPPGFEQFADRFTDADSPERVDYIKGRIEAELKDRETIAHGGLNGYAAALAAGATDPLNLASMLIPVGGEALTAARVGRLAMIGAGTTAVQEAVQHQLQYTKTAGESLENIAGGAIGAPLLEGVLRGFKVGGRAVLANILGPTGAKVPAEAFTRVADDLGKELHNPDAGNQVLGERRPSVLTGLPSDADRASAEAPLTAEEIPARRGPKGGEPKESAAAAPEELPELPESFYAGLPERGRALEAEGSAREMLTPEEERAAIAAPPEAGEAAAHVQVEPPAASVSEPVRTIDRDAIEQQYGKGTKARDAARKGVLDEVQDALDNGRDVTLHVGGAQRRIARVTMGSLEDEHGNTWSPDVIRTQPQGRAHLELGTPAATAAGAEASGSAALERTAAAYRDPFEGTPQRTKDAYDKASAQLKKDITGAPGETSTHAVLDSIISANRRGPVATIARYLKRRIDDKAVTIHTDTTFDGDKVGFYDRKTGKITLGRGADAQTALHEVVHAAVSDFIHKNPAHPLVKELQALYNHVKAGIADNHYGMTDLHEFLAEALTSPSFQKALAQIKSPRGPGSVWNGLVNVIRRMIGMGKEGEKNSALNHALKLADIISTGPHEKVPLRMRGSRPEGADKAYIAVAPWEESRNLGDMAVHELQKGNYFVRTLKDGTRVRVVHVQDESDNGLVMLAPDTDEPHPFADIHEAGKDAEAWPRPSHFIGDLHYSLDDTSGVRGGTGLRHNPMIGINEDHEGKGAASILYQEAERNGGLIPYETERDQTRTDLGKPFRKAKGINIGPGVGYGGTRLPVRKLKVSELPPVPPRTEPKPEGHFVSNGDGTSTWVWAPEGAEALHAMYMRDHPTNPGGYHLTREEMVELIRNNANFYSDRRLEEERVRLGMSPEEVESIRANRVHAVTVHMTTEERRVFDTLPEADRQSVARMTDISRAAYLRHWGLPEQQERLARDREAQAQQAPPDEGLHYSAQRVPQPGQADESIARGGIGSDATILGRVASRVLGRVPPAIRVLRSPSLYARRLVQELANVPEWLNKNVAGVASPQPVERDIWGIPGMIHDAHKGIEQLYRQYLQRTQGGSGLLTRMGASGADSRVAFGEAIGHAMSNGDQHAIPEVEAAAKWLRSNVIDPVTKRAQAVGALPQNLSAPVGAASYFPRIYDILGIQRRQGEWNALLRQGFVAQGIAPVDAMEIADHVTQTLLHNENGPMTDAALDAVMRAGHHQARTLNLPDNLLAPFLHKDANHVLDQWLRNSMPEIMFREKFGNADMEEQLQDVLDDYGLMMARAQTAGESLEPLQKSLSADLRDLRAMRDRLFGRYQRPQDPAAWTMQAIRTARDVNVLNKLGSAAMSHITDIGNVMMRFGAPQTLRALAQLTVSVRGQLWQVASHEAQRMGAALDTAHNITSMALGDYGSLPRSYVSQALGGATRGFGVPGTNFRVPGFTTLTLETPMIDRIQTAAATLASDQILRAAETVAGGGTLAANTATQLASAGIDDAMLRRIATQLPQTQEVGGFRFGMSGSWKDAGAANAFQSAVLRDAHSVTLRPGVGDVPLFMSNELYKLVFQFANFAFAARSVQSRIGQGLSHGDISAVTGLAGLLGLGYLTYALKQRAAGQPIESDPGRVALEVADKTNTLGIAARALPILWEIGYRDLSRWSDSDAAETLFGPAAGTLAAGWQRRLPAKLGRSMGLDTDAQPFDRSDLHFIRRLLPAQNLFYGRQVLNWMEDGVGDMFDLPGISQAQRAEMAEAVGAH